MFAHPFFKGRNVGKSLLLFSVPAIFIGLIFIPASVLAANVSGTVYQSDGTTPVTDAEIQVGVISGDPCGGHNWVASAYTDNGAYTITDVPDGDYYLKATNDQASNWLEEWWTGNGHDPSDPDCRGAFSINISDVDVAGKDFACIGIADRIQSSWAGSLNPKDGTTINRSNPTFSWRPLVNEDIPSLYYLFEISADNGGKPAKEKADIKRLKAA